MKTRNGFVSNSSSSSFIVVATEAAYKEALSRMEDKRSVKIVKAIVENDKCLGTKVKIIKEFTDAGGFSSIWGYEDSQKDEILEKAGVNLEEEDEEFYPAEAVYCYTDILDDMKKEKDWQDQIFYQDVGDGG